MKLSREVFLNQPLIGEVHNGVARPLWKQLLHEAANCRDVQVFSAFYGLNALRDLFGHDNVKGKRSRKLRFVFGRRPPPVLLEQVRELLEFKRTLSKFGYSNKNVEIAVSRPGVFFHTKAYQFRKNTRVRTFVGSANASHSGLSINEELVLKYDGRHDALESYLAHVWNHAESVDTLLPQLEKQDRQPRTLRNMRDFLSDGLLYFRPSRTLSWSMDCFPGDEYQSVSKALTDAQVEPVPPFEIGDATTISLLRLTNATGMGATERVETLGFQLPTYAIETSLGYWVPSFYEEFLDEKLAERTNVRKEQLRSKGEHLAKWLLGPKREFPRFVADINNMLVQEKHRSLDEVEIKRLRERIDRKMNQLIKRTTTETTLNYLCRPMEGVSVPAFWEDQQSAEEFIISFCEYVFTKMQAGGRTPGIIRHLIQGFALHSSRDEDDVRKRIEDRLENDGWRSTDWPETPE